MTSSKEYYDVTMKMGMQMINTKSCRHGDTGPMIFIAVGDKSLLLIYQSDLTYKYLTPRSKDHKLSGF